MEIRELVKQEDLQQILIETLSRNWTDQYGKQVRVLAPEETRGQPWLVRDLLSTYFTADVSKNGRRFMADRFRFTPVRRRAPLQWFFGTLLTTRPLIRRSALAFRVDPPLENCSDLLIVPGSRRIRIFDLDSGVARSVIKEGFNISPIQNEISVRTKSDGPFTSLMQHDPEGTWFEEAIIRGYPLPRIPPWWDRAALEREAIELLTSWSKARGGPIESDDHLEHLRSAADLAFTQIRLRFPNDAPLFQPSLVHDLVTLASGLGSVPVSETHGDFQPGNIQIAHDRSGLHILDWEFAGRRYMYYDLLTYGLHLRYPSGFATRAINFLSSGEAGGASAFLPDVASAAWRRRAFALLALEELARAGEDAATAPYLRPPYSLLEFCKELPQLLGLLKNQ